MKNKYTFRAEIIDSETDEVVRSVSALSQEGLEEEMGKYKWTGAIKDYEEEKERQDREMAEDDDMRSRVDESRDK